MKYFKTYEGYKLGVNGVGSLRNSLAALKRQNINGRYVDPEILAQGIRNEYEAITGEKYEDEVQMSMDNTIADIIGHFKLDGPEFMAAWDKVVKESIVNEKETLASAIEKEMDDNRFNVDVEFFTRDLRQIQNTKNHKDLHPSIKKVLKALKKKYRIRESVVNEAKFKEGQYVKAKNNSDKFAGDVYDIDNEVDGSEIKKGASFEIRKINGGETILWSDDDEVEYSIETDDLKHFVKESVNEAKGGQIMPGDYVKNQHGNVYLRVDGKVGRHDAYVRVTNGKAGKRKTGLHDSFKLTLVNKDGLEESVNEAERYITDEFKVGDKIKTNFGEWEVIETDYAPNKSFIAPFIFKGKDMKRVNIPNPPKTNKNAVGYKVTDGAKYPTIGFLYQYKDITKLATVGVDESVMNESYKGNFTDFKYDLEMAIDNMGISPKAIKAVKKRGKGYEVRLSSYMSDKSTWEKIGDTIGATLISFKPGSINIGIYE